MEPPSALLFLHLKPYNDINRVENPSHLRYSTVSMTRVPEDRTKAIPVVSLNLKKRSSAAQKTAVKRILQ